MTVARYQLTLKPHRRAPGAALVCQRGLSIPGPELNDVVVRRCVEDVLGALGVEDVTGRGANSERTAAACHHEILQSRGFVAAHFESSNVRVGADVKDVLGVLGREDVARTTPRR